MKTNDLLILAAAAGVALWLVKSAPKQVQAQASQGATFDRGAWSGASMIGEPIFGATAADLVNYGWI